MENNDNKIKKNEQEEVMSRRRFSAAPQAWYSRQLHWLQCLSCSPHAKSTSHIQDLTDLKTSLAATVGAAANVQAAVVVDATKVAQALAD